MGSVDGRHVMIERPANSGSIFYNYKGYCSMVMLMAVVNAHYWFNFVSMDGHGQESDGGVWSVIELYRMVDYQP